MSTWAAVMAGRWRLAVTISAVMAVAAVAASPAQVAGGPAILPRVGVPTYSKDVAPIVQKNCQVCHRPGEAGPFSLLTYEDVRPRAAKITKALVAGKMPPWFADPHYGRFSNRMGLSASVIWTNPRYKGRNVYFQFGHKADLFQNSAFTTLFLNAIRWASER